MSRTSSKLYQIIFGLITKILLKPTNCLTIEVRLILFLNIIMQLNAISTKKNLIKATKVRKIKRNLPFVNKIHSSFANINVYIND